MRIVMSDDGHPSGLDASRVFDKKTNDHKILSAALQLQHDKPTMKVVLVSKDLNLRLKAKALNLPAEDFKTGKVKDNKGNKDNNRIMVKGNNNKVDNRVDNKVNNNQATKMDKTKMVKMNNNKDKLKMVSKVSKDNKLNNNKVSNLIIKI